MELKDFVVQRMYNEMEPMRVEVALLHKQINAIDKKSHQVALAGTTLLEKKLQAASPKLEALFDQTNQRLTHAEGVLRELGALHDKFAQRHDSLVECLQDLDKRVEHIDEKLVSSRALNLETGKMLALDLEPRKAPSPLSSRPGLGALTALPEEYIMPPHPLPGLDDRGHAPLLPNCDSSGELGNRIWAVKDHQASLQVEEFSFNVNRRPGTSLGMVLRDDGKKLVVDQAGTDGSLALPVIQGDRIVAIDGIRGHSKELLKLIRRTGCFVITCQRLLSTSL